MSVFHTNTTPPRFSVLRTLALAAVLTGAFMLARPGSPQTATIADALPTVVESPAATVFPEPVAVAWEGRITRMLAGGRGLEILSPEAEGGYFFAYDDDGFPASLSEGPVLVTGRWTGISCEYGRCAPEVEADSAQAAPVELE